MKKLICPSCNHKILDVVGVNWESGPLYYINREVLRGQIWWGEIDKIKPKDKKKYFRGFYCKFCYKNFPESMEKDIFEFLKVRRRLAILKGDAS